MTVGRRADEICRRSGQRRACRSFTIADSFSRPGSTNGTLVNGQPIAKHFLRDGDQIDIGRHILVYCADDDTVLAPDFVEKPARVAAGDLSEQVVTAKPRVRAAGEADVERTGRNRAADSAPGSQPAIAGPAPSGAGVQPAKQAPRTPAAPAPVASVKVCPTQRRSRDPAHQATYDDRPRRRAGCANQPGRQFVRPQTDRGRPAPLVNGNALAAEGAALTSGDVIEIAGARLEFVGLPQPVDAR
jgi:hypothetical protein